MVGDRYARVQPQLIFDRRVSESSTISGDMGGVQYARPKSIVLPLCSERYFTISLWNKGPTIGMVW